MKMNNEINKKETRENNIGSQEYNGERIRNFMAEFFWNYYFLF